MGMMGVYLKCTIGRFEDWTHYSILKSLNVKYIYTHLKIRYVKIMTLTGLALFVVILVFFHRK